MNFSQSRNVLETSRRSNRAKKQEGSYDHLSAQNRASHQPSKRLLEGRSNSSQLCAVKLEDCTTSQKISPPLIVAEKCKRKVAARVWMTKGMVSRFDSPRSYSDQPKLSLHQRLNLPSLQPIATRPKVQERKTHKPSCFIVHPRAQISQWVEGQDLLKLPLNEAGTPCDQDTHPSRSGWKANTSDTAAAHCPDAFDSCLKVSFCAIAPKRPSTPKSSTTDSVQRRVTLSDTSSQGDGPITRSAARPFTPAPVTTRPQAPSPSMRTIRMACSSLKTKYRRGGAVQNRNWMPTIDCISLQNMLLAIPIAVVASIMMTVSSIMSFTYSLVFDSRRETICSLKPRPPSASSVTHKNKMASPRSPCLETCESYRSEWQLLHFMEMSDRQLGDFSPYWVHFVSSLILFLFHTFDFSTWPD